MNPLYDAIGGSYRTTRRAEPGILKTLAAGLGLPRDGAFLDLGCGTGYTTCALAEIGGRWHGVDVSGRMLSQAATGSDRIAWRLGSAERLPFEAGSFEGVICTLAIHHFPDLPAAFREVSRVLAAGRFVVFTSFPDQTRRYWQCHYFPEMMERSIEQMPARETVT